MKFFLSLSMENLDLSRSEVINLINPKKFMFLNNLIILDSRPNSLNLIKRLAYARESFKLLFISNNLDLKNKVNSFNWKKYYNSNFCVRSNSSKLSEKDLASLIWKRLESQKINPKVTLKDSKTQVNFFLIKNKVVCGIKFFENLENFNARKPHNRPALHPSSLNPKLARAMINLTGIKKGKIYDPFCGSGGILLEAGLMNITPIGSDISKDMLNRSNKVLNHLKIKDFNLFEQDALKIKKKYDYIISDLPYGKNVENINSSLYKEFISLLPVILKKKAVLGFPNTLNVKRLFKKYKIKIEKEFSFYLHKSLSKKIYVISLN